MGGSLPLALPSHTQTRDTDHRPLLTTSQHPPQILYPQGGASTINSFNPVGGTGGQGAWPVQRRGFARRGWGWVLFSNGDDNVRPLGALALSNFLNQQLVARRRRLLALLAPEGGEAQPQRRQQQLDGSGGETGTAAAGAHGGGSEGATSAAAVFAPPSTVAPRNRSAEAGRRAGGSGGSASSGSSGSSSGSSSGNSGSSSGNSGSGSSGAALTVPPPEIDREAVGLEIARAAATSGAALRPACLAGPAACAAAAAAAARCPRGAEPRAALSLELVARGAAEPPADGLGFGAPAAAVAPDGTLLIAALFSGPGDAAGLGAPAFPGVATIAVAPPATVGGSSSAASDGVQPPALRIERRGARAVAREAAAAVAGGWPAPPAMAVLEAAAPSDGGLVFVAADPLPGEASGAGAWISAFDPTAAL